MHARMQRETLAAQRSGTASDMETGKSYDEQARAATQLDAAAAASTADRLLFAVAVRSRAAGPAFSTPVSAAPRRPPKQQLQPRLRNSLPPSVDIRTATTWCLAG